MGCFTTKKLAPLIPIFPHVEAAAVNDSGVVVGHCGVSNYFFHASIWKQPSDPKGLGVLPGADWSSALDVNNQEQVIGQCWSSSKPKYAGGFLWTAQKGMQAIGNPSPVNKFYPIAINDSSVILGNAVTAVYPYVTSRAMILKNGKFIDLGLLPGTGESVAVAINNAGQVVGNCGSKPFLWTEQGGIQPIVWSNGTFSQVQDLTEEGKILLSGQMGGAWKSFVWKTEADVTPIEIPETGPFAPPDNETYYPMRINDKGDMIIVADLVGPAYLVGNGNICLIRGSSGAFGDYRWFDLNNAGYATCNQVVTTSNPDYYIYNEGILYAPGIHFPSGEPGDMMIHFPPQIPIYHERPPRPYPSPYRPILPASLRKALTSFSILAASIREEDSERRRVLEKAGIGSLLEAVQVMRTADSLGTELEWNWASQEAPLLAGLSWPAPSKEWIDGLPPYLQDVLTCLTLSFRTAGLLDEERRSRTRDELLKGAQEILERQLR